MANTSNREKDTTMKIKVEFTINIDADAWRNEYGVENVRADVQQYAHAAVIDQFASLGLLA